MWHIIDKMGKCIIPMLVLLTCITIVSAVPQIPESYWGYATLNGAPAAYGTPITVEVYGTGEVVESTTVQYPNGGYSLAIIFDDPDTPEDEGANAGDKLTWKINSLICSIPAPGTDTATFGGTNSNFNLTATSVNDPPSVTVLYPNGGESIRIGTRVEVSAQAMDDNAVRGVTFYYSRDGGSNWYLIGEGAKVSGAAKGGIWNKTWDTNGLNASTIYLIKAVASDGALTSEDRSDSTFSLTTSNVIYVPDDYPTIQAAVDAASPGNTIIVRDGTYIENVDVNKPHLTIKSENGAEKKPFFQKESFTKETLYFINITTVQAANSNDHVFEVTSDYVTISGFTVRGATSEQKAGIYLSSVKHCNVSNNIASNNCDGIVLYHSNCNVLINNIANSNSDEGFDLSGCSNNTLINNTVSNNGDGIYLRGNNNLLNGNTAISNMRSGINVWYGDNNILTKNIASNNDCGLHLRFSNSSLIYKNNFINNNENARSTSSTNIWNSPSKLTYSYNDNTHTSYLGNYWDEYSGSDANGDGIGDIPYRIDSDNDFYPLMMPVENYVEQQATRDRGLVAEWRFDEGPGNIVKDSSGNGNDGTVHGATFVDGVSGYALNFDGVDDYVNVKHNEIFNAREQITIEAWINWKPGARGIDLIVDKGGLVYWFIT